MAYVDGFLVPVPEKNLADYKRLAKLASKVEVPLLDGVACAISMAESLARQKSAKARTV